ncbi:MAG: CdaR family protein [Bdellovibrionia bacterium]
MKRSFSWSEYLTDNMSYKVVSLIIALILWITILGRRDFVMTKSIEIDLLAAPGTTVVSQTADQIKVKVSGPRTALKKFMDSATSQSLAIDVAKQGIGNVDIQVPVSKIEVPLGVRVVGVRPNVIRAEIIQVNKENLNPVEPIKE